MNSKRSRTLYILLAAVFAAGIAFAQGAPANGSDGNKEYEEMSAQVNMLRKSEDSVQNLIGRNRSLYEKNPGNADAYAKEIVKLEDELYNIRNKIAQLGSRMAQIEQEFITREINAPSGNGAEVFVQDGSKESRTLFLNEFFTANVPAKDIRAFLKSPLSEAKVYAAKEEIDMLYRRLSELKAAYDASQRQEEVDRMLEQSKDLIQAFRQIDKQIADDWGAVYNLKIDTYAVLLDKLDGVDRIKLEQLDQQSRTVRRAESLAGEQLAPNLIVFPLQKELALSYETLLASNLGLKLALDSLQKEAADIPKNIPEYPRIEFKPRNLIIYSPVNLDGKYPYSSLDSIPDIKIPTQGIYYVISVAVMAKPPTSLAFFKGGDPLQKQLLDEGSLRYSLGGFDKHEDAQKAVAQLLKAGFKAPNIIAWVDGVQTTALKAKAAEAELPKPAAGFKIEVIARDPSVSLSLREIVDQNAPGKQIGRLSEEGNYIFTITRFATREEAEKIAGIIGEKGELEVKIINLEDN